MILAIADLAGTKIAFGVPSSRNEEERRYNRVTIAKKRSKSRTVVIQKKISKR